MSKLMSLSLFFIDHRHVGLWAAVRRLFRVLKHPVSYTARHGPKYRPRSPCGRCI